jgi:hypothetical protein
MEKVSKKRGRKPKNSIKEVSTSTNLGKIIDDNMIIRIKINNKTNINETILPGYNCIAPDNFITDDTCSKCWNCFHDINSNKKSIPLYYENGVFYIYGYFCTNGCCLRYISETFKNNELWSKYEIFQFYNREIYGENINIKLPPSKFSLKEFGGNLTIEEYRKEKEYKEINIPIIIPIKNNYNNKITHNFKDNGELKLFRKSKKDKTIINNMNNID